MRIEATSLLPVNQFQIDWLEKPHDWSNRNVPIILMPSTERIRNLQIRFIMVHNTFAVRQLFVVNQLLLSLDPVVYSIRY